MYKIVHHRFNPRKRTVRYVYGGPQATVIRRRRWEWVCALVLLAASITLAWVAR